MARKSLQDLSGIANTIARSSKSAPPTPRSGAPALGALQGALTAIREIDPALIDDWGPQDRLDGFTAVNSDDDTDGFEALKASIQDGGQQVPILVRRSATDGRYQVIYGRRRLKACRDLGMRVRANVQDLDDTQALLAKGLENAARRNLSFYEKARFASVILTAGHDTKEVRQVLNLSAPGLSHLTKVTDNVPDPVGDVIGAAPKSGRPRWTLLAEAFAAQKITQTAALKILQAQPADMASDAKLDNLLTEIARRGTRPRAQSEITPVRGVTIKSGQKSVAVSIAKSGENAAFGEWLDRNLSDLIKKSFAEFTAVNSDKDT